MQNTYVDYAISSLHVFRTVSLSNDKINQIFVDITVELLLYPLDIYRLENTKIKCIDCGLLTVSYFSELFYFFLARKNRIIMLKGDKLQVI